MRELRRRAKSAVARIKHFDSRILNRSDDAGRDPTALACKGFRLRDCALDHSSLFDHVAMFFLVGIRDAEQHTPETGAPVSVIRRKICSSVKWLAIRSEKRRQRPSALSTHGLHGSLIAAINIRTLVTVDLHGNEVLVDDLSDCWVVVRLTVHHVTPVA